MGALIKNVYGPRVLERDPADVVSVSVMPCTAKKDEAHRPADRRATYSEKLDATVGGLRWRMWFVKHATVDSWVGRFGPPLLGCVD